jgi:hypothetical protein
MTPYFRFVRWLHQFEEWPNYNRFGAGLYTLLWTHYCGYDWKFAWHSACIYWWGRRSK